MFNPEVFIKNAIDEITQMAGSEKVIAACSGGVDSTACVALGHRAVGDRMLAVFIDDGLRRENEPEAVETMLKDLGINAKLVHVEEEMFAALKGKTDAEEKRIAFRERFYTILGRIVKEEQAKYLLQGTIAADIVETDTGIKTQHNVLEQIGIDPMKYGFKVMEPLRELYKPQVRMVARELKLPPEISERMPFPGPALSIRIIGEVTPERTKIAKRATQIVEEETQDLDTFQSFAVLHNDKATGIKEGKRLYGNIITVRIVDSEDAITAQAKEIPYSRLKKIANRITSEIPSVSRCLLDITDKPPATIEFE